MHSSKTQRLTICYLRKTRSRGRAAAPTTRRYTSCTRVPLTCCLLRLTSVTVTTTWRPLALLSPLASQVAEISAPRPTPMLLEGVPARATKILHHTVSGEDAVTRGWVREAERRNHAVPC